MNLLHAIPHLGNRCLVNLAFNKWGNILERNQLVVDPVDDHSTL